jgi:pyruvate/2-oxoglutarate dehydrogenase complex dihydrolipoamide dehydrogenase (E3) component
MLINGRNIINSDQILDLPELPKTLIVVGGGVIGVEYTCMFAALGIRVIEKRSSLLEFADHEIVEALSHHLRDSRVTMRLNERGGECRGGGRWNSCRKSRKQEEDFRRRTPVCRRTRREYRRAKPLCCRNRL